MRKTSFYYSNKSNDYRQIYQGGEKKVMRKSLSMLLAIAMIFSMFSSLAFAADAPTAPTTAQEKYDALAAKGIFAGIDGEAALDQPMNRAQFARVAALILGLDGIGETDTKEVTVKPFSDVELGLWYTEEIAAAKEAKIFVGNPDGTFNPTGDITVQELAVVVAGLLNLEEVEDAKVEGAADWAAGEIQAILNAKIDFPTNYKENAIRSDLASLAYAAYVAVEAAKIPPIPATLEVKSISSTNLKTFTVVFNQPVDKDTVTNDGTIKVTDKPSTVKLSDDATTAYVILTSEAKQSDELEFVVNGVKTKDAKEIKDYKVKVLAIDSTVPVATGATFINHKEIEVQFSEPMNFAKTYFEGLSDVKLDGASVVAKTSVDYVKNTVRFQFASLLKDGTVKFEISNIADFAGYKIAKAEFDVLVVEDKAAPVLASAEVKNLTTIEVTFNERIETQGTFKVNGSNATATAVADSNGTKFSLTGFTSTGLDLGATVEIKVAYKGQKDVAGNEVKDEVIFTFKVIDDTTLPSVSVAVEKENKVVLTFSKSMQTTLGTIKVLDKDKKDLNSYNVSGYAASKWSKNNTVLTLAASDLGLALADPTTYFLVIKDMKDSTVRTNLLPEQTIEIKSVDTKVPTVAASYLAKNGTLTGTDIGNDDTITFYFSEAVDADTAKNLSNYNITAGGPSGYIGTLSGVTTIKVAFKSISSNGKEVTLTYEDARSASPTITVYAIKDVAGNMMASTSTSKYGGTRHDILTNKATSKNKVEVTFFSEVGRADPSALAIYDTVTDLIVTQFISATIDGSKVTFTTASDIGAATGTYELRITNKDALTNVFGLKITDSSSAALDNGDDAFTAAIADEIKPGVKEAKRHATSLYQFIITFDEAIAINDSSLIRVRNKDNELISTYTPSVSGDSLIITLNATYNDVINVTLEAGAIEDAITPTNVNAYYSVTSSDKIKY
ncbi:MAG: S-layer homology domain-containing protein [Paenibacillaceae bacterium]